MAALGTALLAALLALRAAEAGPKPVKMPNIQGMRPKMGKGPPWRVATEKAFTEACQMNKGQPSVFCFPNIKELLEGLLKAKENGAEPESEMFLLDLHVVVETLLGWPSAWADVSKVLATKHAWTKAYCNKIMGDSPIWHPHPLLRKSFITPRQTLAQVEKQTGAVAISMNRWFDDLQKNGDGKTKELLRALKAQDKIDVKNRSVHARPMMRLMMHEHAKVLKHIFGKACKNSMSVWAKLEKADANGLTPLHHVASLGDASGCEALLKAAGKAKRSKLAGARDRWGYTPGDVAERAHFEEAAAVLRTLGGNFSEAPGTTPPADPVALFPAARAASVGAAEAEEECHADGSAGGSSSCSAGASSLGSAAKGGWRGWQWPDDPKNRLAVPAEWLPPAEMPCFADTIDVSQFDFEVFAGHYLLHQRPLLVKGGAKLAQASGNWSRQGLLRSAGERKVKAELFQLAQSFDGSQPLQVPLHEYLRLLDNRSTDLLLAKRKLQYAYLPLDANEVFLNFSANLPTFLEGQVEHRGTIFALGGVLMGAPPHHHGPAVSLLAFGSKLWFLDPPGRELVVHEPVYDYLRRTAGAAGSARCLQEAGDALFVPRGWTHATVCLSDCVGASVEVTHQHFDLRDA